MIIVLHFHTRAGTVPFAITQLSLYVDDGTGRRWFLVLVGVISDVTFNKVVGYKMYDDVDDSYNL